MKHVWILNHYAQEPGQIGLTRHYYLARHLPASGWKASIIAASTEHNTGRQRLTDTETTRLEIHGGVPFLWLRTPYYRGNGFDRVWNMIVYTWRALSARNLAILEKPDLILGSSVHPLAALAGYRLSRRHNVPFVFEVRDLWPQTLIDMGRISQNGLAARVLRALETFLYRRACCIVTPLPNAKDYITRLAIPADRIVHISNGVDLTTFPSTPYPKATSGPFELMYFGAHGEANGLETLVRAMSIVERSSGPRPVRLRMIGEGPKKEDLKRLARDLGINNIEFEAAVPKSSIVKVASEAHAFVVCLQNLPGLYRYGISLNKIFDYLAAARPVVMAATAVENPIAEAGSGLIVPPEDPEKLAAGILALAAMPEDELERMGVAGRRHVEQNYTFENLAARLAAALDGCLEKRR